MSIISDSQELQHPPYTDLDPAECAYCDLDLTFPCVFWITAKGQGLYAHHACARRWVQHLIDDIHTIDALMNDAAPTQQWQAESEDMSHANV